MADEFEGTYDHGSYKVHFHQAVFADAKGALIFVDVTDATMWRIHP